MSKTDHVWSFSTVGGVKRVNLESGKDLLHLEELDQKLWTALSCPVRGLEIDDKTLELIDTDNDGHIRVPEIIAAVKWMISILNDPADLLKQEQVLPFSAINQSSPEGKRLLASARIILKNLGKENQQYISRNETSDTGGIFAKTSFNGDGIIGVDAAADPEIRKLISEIMACVGSTTDRNGSQGISMELLDLFFAQAAAFSGWYAKAEADASAILPFGDETENAYGSYLAIKHKVEDYFIRCRLATFDPDATQALNQLVTRVELISPKDLSGCMDEIATYPLAKVGGGKALPLASGTNPAWNKALLSFHKNVVLPLFGEKSQLSENEWQDVSLKFEPYAKWKNEEEGKAVEGLGKTRVREILAGEGKTVLSQLIEQDKALENEANGIIEVDQLVRYYSDLFRLLKNFVTFYDFYSAGSDAIFLAGTLYIDQRSCNLCLKVNDMGKHNAMVALSGMYLLYCDCVSKLGGDKMTIVAALTNGDVDNLVVGRNALFYDRDGLDWDATIVKIVENPISIRQAFFSPYRKVARFIESQVEKFAAEKDKEGMEKAQSNVAETSNNLVTSPSPAKAAAPFDIGKFVGIFAAISLALGAIGGVLASFISGFLALVWWKMPIALMGVLLCISGPAMIMAWMKLRKRNLAPLLDANGWAINARAVVNIQFGNTLTHLAALPANARLNLNDPFRKKKNPFASVFIILLLVAALTTFLLWKYGIFN